MARALDHHPAVAREPTVHLGGVVVGDVVALRATDPQHRPVVRRVPEVLVGPPDHLVHGLGQQVQVHLPVPAVVGAPQVLQQEAAHDRVGHRLTQRLVRVGATLEPGQVEPAHGAGVADELPSARVRRGRHVDDHEALDQRRVAQCQAHRDLAAHRVPDERQRPVLLQSGGHPVCQVEVVEAVGPLRAAVVGHVDQHHAVLRAQLLGDLRPVLPLPEQAVAEGQGGPALAQDGGVQPGAAVFSSHRTSIAG